MKRILSFLLIISILTSFTSIISANQQQIFVEQVNYKIVLDGKEQKIHNPIVSFQDRTYLPLRELAELLNLYVVWDGEEQIIKISDIGRIYEENSDTPFSEENKNIPADLAAFKIKVNGYVRELEHAIFVIRDRTYLPVREIAELFKLEVDWNGTDKVVGINTNRTESEEAEKKLLRFMQGKYWGYMDEEGNVVIPPQYLAALDFSEGLAAVVNEEYYYGYIDTEGNTVIPHKYHVAGFFSEGLAYVSERNFKISNEDPVIAMSMLNDNYGMTYYYIDKAGNRVIEEEFLGAGEFRNGLAPVRMNDPQRKDDHTAYINKQGERVLDFDKQTSVGVFEDGYALLKGYMIVNTNFESVFYGGAYESFDLKNGFITAKKKKGKYGVVDLNDNVIIDFKYDELSTYNEGLFVFKDQQGKGYIDINDNVVIPPIFRNAEVFYNGIAIVDFYEGSEEEDATIDIINKNGEYVKKNLKLDWDAWYYKYSNGMIKVEKNDGEYYLGCYYINTQGENIKPKL